MARKVFLEHLESHVKSFQRYSLRTYCCDNFTILTFQKIELGKVYNVAMYIMSVDSVDLSVSLTSSDGSQHIAQHTIK
jgi:hypothetical protein